MAKAKKAKPAAKRASKRKTSADKSKAPATKKSKRKVAKPKAKVKSKSSPKRKATSATKAKTATAATSKVKRPAAKSEPKPAVRSKSSIAPKRSSAPASAYSAKKFADRDAAYATLGSVSKDVLAPIIGPLLLGGPMWPQRPQWRVITRKTTTIIISDGLSDCFDDGSPGFGLEVMMEAPTAELGAKTDIGVIGQTWLFAAVQELSGVVAGHGGVRELFEELGAISVEVNGDAFPSTLRNGEGRVGVLLHKPSRDVPATIKSGGADIYLIAATVLTTMELAAIIAGKQAARTALAAALSNSPLGHVSSVSRVSLAL
jgi:hypothetical protein